MKLISFAHGGYINVHAWQFTPASFGTAIVALNNLGLCQLSCAHIHNTPFGLNEFTAVLEKPA